MLFFRKRAAVLGHGETLVSIDGGPALPATLGPAPEWVLRREYPGGIPTAERSMTHPWFRRSVAHWLGVYLEAVTAEDDDERIRFEWDGGSLHIVRTNLEGMFVCRPEVIYPDDAGRYPIRSVPWDRLVDAEIAAYSDRHRVALGVLAGNANPYPAAPMLTYLASEEDVTGEVRDRIEAIIRVRSAATPLDEPVRINVGQHSRSAVSEWQVGWCNPDGRQPVAVLHTRHLPGIGYLATIGVVWATYRGMARIDQHPLRQEEVILGLQPNPFVSDWELDHLHETALATLRLRFVAGEESVVSFFDPASTRFAT